MKKCKVCNNNLTSEQTQNNKNAKFCSLKCNGISQRKHGLKGTRFNRIFKTMKCRCKFSKYYKNVKVEWKDCLSFKNDMYKSYLEHCEKFGEKQTSIDRINNNGNYCKENCRWATMKEQASNRNIKNMTWYKSYKQTLD